MVARAVPLKPMRRLRYHDLCPRRRCAAPFCAALTRYLWGTLGELAGLRRSHLRVTLDRAVLHSGNVLFASNCNTPIFSSGMPAAPHATHLPRPSRLAARRPRSVSSSLFACCHCCFALTPPARLLSSLPCPIYRCRSTSDTPLPLAADGDRCLPSTRSRARTISRSPVVFSAAAALGSPLGRTRPRR